LKEIHNMPYNIHSKVQRIQIKGFVLAKYIDLSKHEQEQFNKEDTNFGYVDLELELANDILPDFDIVAARVHAWSFNDKATPHFDSASQFLTMLIHHFSIRL